MSIPPPPTAWSSLAERRGRDVQDGEPGGAADEAMQDSQPSPRTPWNNPLYQLETSAPESYRQLNPTYTRTPATGAPFMAPGQTHGATARRELQDTLGEQIERLLEGGDPIEVLLGLEWLSHEYAGDLRDQASTQLHRAARHICLRSEAEEMDGEAATWCLLRHLFASGSVADAGPELPRVGLAKTRRQRAAECISSDHSLNVAARVVAWLECLASRSLENEDRQRPASTVAFAGRFAARESLWRGTRSKVARGLEGDHIATELDPDGPGRQQRSLDADNAKDEERLMAQCWKYVRSGRTASMLELCAKCGQPWRVASLSAGSLSGLIASVSEGPLCDTAKQHTAMPAEAEEGLGDVHSLLRWSAYQASEQAAKAVEATGGGAGGGDYEAAVYAALCGHVSRMLKVCKTWEDACWAYFRSFLDVSVDGQLSAPSGLAYFRSDWNVAESETCSILGRHAPRHRDGVADCAKAQAGAVVDGQWPLSSMLDEVPGSIEECFVKLRAHHLPAADSLFKRYQTEMILATAHEDGSFEDMLKDLSVQVQTHLQQAFFSDTAAADKPPGEKPHLIRFAAHLAILLDVLASPDGQPRDDLGAQQNAVNNLVQCYVVQLVEERQHRLVPLYCCMLRPLVRELTYNIYLKTVEADTMEDCRAVFEISRDCFDKHGVSRAGGAGVEMYHLVAAYAARVLASCDSSPLHKVTATRWLAFTPDTEPLAVQHVNSLCRGLLVGVDIALANRLAKKLFDDILPPDLVARGSSAELACWHQYFSIQAELEDWEAQHQSAAASAEAGAALAELAAKALRICQAGVDLVSGGWVRGAGQDAGMPHWLSMAVAPSEQFAPQEAEYQLMPHDVAAHLATQLQELWDAELGPWAAQQLGAEGALEFSAQILDEEASPVLIDIRCDAQDANAVAVVGELVGALLKGEAAAGSGHQLRGLRLCALTFDASAALAHAVCRQILVPRLLLQCSRLKMIHAEITGRGVEEPDIAMLVSDPSTACLETFSTTELQELLETVRRGSVASFSAATPAV
eukprot:jgi/Tetstr1/424730/TSEL_015248.t1